MYLGRIVEIGPADQVAREPEHPYTRALLGAVPGVGVSRVPLMGEPASAVNPPSGCSFHPRCAVAEDGCATRRPQLRSIGTGTPPPTPMPALELDPERPSIDPFADIPRDHVVDCVHADLEEVET
jgi:oligopeptide/dipeptide ABC transporter ATP-binding protein